MHALILLAALAIGQAPIAAGPSGTDVPQNAVWEAERRGNMVQVLGNDYPSETDLIADALAPPEDDSHKWYLTVVTMTNCPACEKLKEAFKSAPQMKAWVNVDDPEKSTCHYQVRNIEDKTQQDWFAAIGPQLKKGGFPAVIIQPPRNGAYGANSTVVKVLHGFDGDAEKYTRRMRDAIVVYVQELNKKGLIQRRGDNAERLSAWKESRGPIYGGHSQIGVDPPFGPAPVNPFKVDPHPNADWPPTPPAPLTLAELKELVPSAPNEFLLAQLEAKASDKSAVLVAWNIYALQHAKEPNKNPSQPAPPRPDQAETVAGAWFEYLKGVTHLAMIIGLVVGALKTWRKIRQWSGSPTLLDDAQFKELTDWLESIEAKVDQVVTPSPTPPQPQPVKPRESLLDRILKRFDNKVAPTPASEPIVDRLLNKIADRITQRPSDAVIERLLGKIADGIVAKSQTPLMIIAICLGFFFLVKSIQ